MRSLFPIDRQWTLFLDRDGVINHRLVGDYVKEWSEFAFLPGVPAALAQLTRYFGRTVVVTNQQGIYKGLMSEADLTDIHQRMLAELQAADAHIDAIYHCPASDADDPTQCRKPRLGMAHQAQQAFPDIDLTRSLMVGDSVTDLQFGRKAGMRVAYVADTDLPSDQRHWYDIRVSGLPHLLTQLPA